MSQQYFLAALVAIIGAGLAAIWAFIFGNTGAQPRVRAVITLGLSLVDWHRLWADWGWQRPGQHRAPRGWTPAKEMVPGGMMLAFDPAYPDREPLLVSVDQSGVVHVVKVRQEPPIEQAIAAMIARVETPMPVRVAEILAHQEDDTHALEQSERTSAGATEDWSPVAQVAVERPRIVLASSTLDSEAQGILDAFELSCADARKVPEWADEWGRKVDASLEASGMNAEPHKRWRAGVLDFPTGELPKVLMSR